MKTDKKAVKANEVNETGLATAQAATFKLEERQGKAIRGCCQVIIDKTVEAGRLYLDLCLYIRKNEVSPKLVSREMGDMGFNRQVISRVNKVANASDELWNEFAARTIGFNKVLELSRSTSAMNGLAKDTDSDIVDIKVQVEELEKGGEESGPAAPPTPEQREASAKKALESAAAKLLSAAASLQLKREKTIVGGNGYLVIVKKDKNWKPAPVKSEGQED